MHPRRLLASWLFALTLLFGQAAAFAHALSHLHERDHGLPDKACEVCVSQAELGSAAPPAALVLPCAPAVHAVAASPALTLPDPARIVSRARAPPARSV
jgi:hypothetical protein